MRTRQLLSVALIGAGALALGCRVDTHKNGDGDNVKIATPFGGMQVKTNDAAVQTGIGLPEYPGAVLVKKDKNSGAADINMSFGRFQLRVKAVSYRTDDAPDKIQAFYRNAMRRFGDVILCSDNHPVGTPVRTAEGLTCDKERDNHVAVREDASGDIELKAGSQQHQHIVTIEHDGGGTKFGLVALDLPGHISIGEKDSDERQ
jgi:hypothetical protein